MDAAGRDLGVAVAVLRGLEARLEHLEGVLKPDARSAFDTLVAVYPTGGVTLWTCWRRPAADHAGYAARTVDGGPSQNTGIGWCA